MLFITLLACQTPADCAAGFTLDDDGMCYGTGPEDTDPPAAEPPTIENVLEALPACEPVTGSGQLDFITGCADGACPGMTYSEIVTALGDDGVCSGQYLEFDEFTLNSASCDWDNGVSTTFADEDRDGVPDEFDTAFSIYVMSTFEGTTEHGLGIGVQTSCFIDELGVPDTVGFTLVDKDWLLSGASWGAGGVSLSDSYNTGGSFEPDGLADTLYLYGRTGEL